MDYAKVGEIIVGSIPGIIAILIFMSRIDRKLAIFMIEHEMLMNEYAESKGIKVKDLPTRTGRIIT